MDEQKLNRKLAEWAGFNKTDVGGGFIVWISPDGMEADIQFTHSLDACFQWLAPNWNKQERSLPTWIENITFCMLAGNLIKCTIQQFDVGNDTWADGEAPALAFCLALEKLIDRE